MGGDVFSCSCGIKTTKPYWVNGVKVCTICAELMAPRLVRNRISRDWADFSRESRRMTRFPHARYARDDDDY